MRLSQHDAAEKESSDGLDIIDDGKSVNTHESGLWCESCGSPIPKGAIDCPVCGMPAPGVFDEPWDGLSKKNSEDEPSEPMLASAIPPAPEPGEPDEQVDDVPARTRLIIIAAISALLVVGGTTLFITRPWDPEAYITHTTVETDISKERTIDEVSHLSGQDHIADAKREEYLNNAEAKVNTFVELIDEVAKCCDDIESSVDESFARGELPQDSRVKEISEYRDKLKQAHDEVSNLDLRESAYQDRAKQILVASEYLQGRVETLCGVCETIDTATDSGAGIVAAESRQDKGKDGRSLDEWRKLFQNAYAGLGTADE